MSDIHIGNTRQKNLFFYVEIVILMKFRRVNIYNLFYQITCSLYVYIMYYYNTYMIKYNRFMD